MRRLSERILFYNRLSLYLRSGIPIRHALGFIRDSARQKATRRILEEVDYAVLHGSSLARALATFPRAFPSFETHLIEIGERSGSLPEKLAYLASLLTKRRALSHKVRSALLYPCIIVLGTIGVTGFLLLYTFPKIVPIFRGLNARLPLTTRLLIGISDTVEKHGLLLLCLTGVIAAFSAWGTKLPVVQERTGRLFLTFPAVGWFIRTYYLALISRTLGTLLSSGISLISALSLVGGGIRQPGYREAMASLSEEVRDGQKLSDEFRKYPKLFPYTFVELITAGESTGSLGVSLGTAAELYEEELNDGVHTLTTLIEPAIMVAMGLLVGFIAMAIITPIYGITQNLTSY